MFLVSPPLPPPPSGDVDDSHFGLPPAAPFDSRYSTNSAVLGGSIDYGGSYGGDYNARRSRLDEDDDDWIPEHYLEKGMNYYCFRKFCENFD
jgi:hypothetical protein